MGGRFFGGVIGGALPASVAAHWLADAWDQNACLYDISPVAAHMEDVVLSWILDLLGPPPNSGGALVTGTQMADVTALAAARSSVTLRTKWVHGCMWMVPSVSGLPSAIVESIWWRVSRRPILGRPMRINGSMCRKIAESQS
jgi:hypothetical protein